MDLNSAPSPYPLFGSAYDHTAMYGDHDQGFSRQDHYRSGSYGDGYSSYEVKNYKADCSDFELSLAKKRFEDQVQESMSENDNISTADPRMIGKMIKNTPAPDRLSIKVVRSGNRKIEDQKLQRRLYSPPPSSSSSSSEVFEPSKESPPHNDHMAMSPVRVCTDCKTTKTPLWRSGPNGPKSLCNACGIRQRKARRAMAAAAGGGMSFSATKQPRSMKKKIDRKEKAAKNNCRSSSSHLKKRFKNTAADHTSNIVGPLTSNDGQKKIGGIEDFLMNLSDNLALHRVFPEDEKDAAILLMAISSGLVHG